MRCKGPARAIDQATDFRLDVVVQDDTRSFFNVRLLDWLIRSEVAMRAMIQQIDSKLSKLAQKLRESGTMSNWPRKDT